MERAEALGGSLSPRVRVSNPEQWPAAEGIQGASLCFIYLNAFFFFPPHLWHMEVPGVGVESELQLGSTPQQQPHQI